VISIPQTETWEAIRSEFEEQDMLIFSLEAKETKNRVTLHGEIGSEKEKAALETLVTASFPDKPVYNKMIVTGVFQSASQSHFDNLI
jgi:succinyl-CoA synthetase alpha subunit